MHEHIENAMRKYLLKSFKISRKVSANDFNKNIYKKKLKNTSKKREFKALFDDIKIISPETTLDKEKPIPSEEQIIIYHEGDSADFSEINPSNQEEQLEEEIENNQSNEYGQLNDKIIKCVQFLHEMIFKYLGNNEIDKEATITVMNIINKMIYQNEHITEEDIKNYIKKNKKEN